MDRDAIARERRREEALDALGFEREREAALRDQVGETVLEAERDRIDQAALARLEPRDAALVREILGADTDDGVEDDWDEVLADFADEPDDDGLSEDEVARLLGEIAASQERQQALERFVAALDDPEPATPTD